MKNFPSFGLFSPKVTISRNKQSIMPPVEHLDVFTHTGERTAISKPRQDVHRDGDYHRAVFTWIFCESTQELLLQKRADCKESHPGLWDISSAGHISAGDTSLWTARRELLEELGVNLPKDAFELLFECTINCTLNDGKYINNEFVDVYMVTTLDLIPLDAFTLQFSTSKARAVVSVHKNDIEELTISHAILKVKTLFLESEVSAVEYIPWQEYKTKLAEEHSDYVSYDISGEYGKLFSMIERRYKVDKEPQLLELQKQVRCYSPTPIEATLTGVSEADKEALIHVIKAAKIIDEIFYSQVWYTNPGLRDWLKEQSSVSEINQLKWICFSINKGPWSCIDDNKAFLSTADSYVKLSVEATKPVAGWKGIEYRATFPIVKPPGANFYPPDMDKTEFDMWKHNLPKDEQKAAMSYFTVIRRSGDFVVDDSTNSSQYLFVVPFCNEYGDLLSEASKLLRKAGEITESPSLKRYLQGRADAFSSNDYYESDKAWMDLDSKLDVTIGPYETYEDTLFGYKTTFEAFIGIRDELATSHVKLFGDHLLDLEQNLPLDDIFKSKDVVAAPIRVVQLIYNSGDVKGPQTVAFNLPNDERIVNEHGTAMVMLKNVSEAKFKKILQPIADICISEEQRAYVDFESFFTHIICHECCHGIGPHTIKLSDGHESTVRLELQELHSALEEAKADIVGLWAVKFLIFQGLLPESLTKSMYVSFLAGCFRSVRFGLEEAHGKGQALQFNWLFKKGAFALDVNGNFYVNFTKVEHAVESLSREILTIQAKGDKAAAKLLLDKYATMSEPLKNAKDKLELVQVPIDITPIFISTNSILAGTS